MQAFLSTCMTTSRIPSKWKTAKVITILKPKKPADDPKSYRPISFQVSGKANPPLTKLSGLSTT